MCKRCMGTRGVCMMMGWYNRKISEVGRRMGAGFSTCSLWSRAGGPCFGGLVLWCRALPRPGGTGALCPPRWRSAQTRPSGWAADCQGRPERWGPRAHTQTCKHSAPLPPVERGNGLSHIGMCSPPQVFRLFTRLSKSYRLESYLLTDQRHHVVSPCLDLIQ